MKAGICLRALAVITLAWTVGCVEPPAPTPMESDHASALSERVDAEDCGGDEELCCTGQCAPVGECPLALCASFPD